MKYITEDLLINLAGKAAFTRGKKLFEQGKVLSIEPFKDHKLATVQGTQVYAVDIIHTQRMFQGSCNCRASEGVDFCKHCVAVALHLKNEQADNTENSANLEKIPKTTKKPTAKEKQLKTIQQYLSSLTKTELETQLFNFIEQIPDLRVQWLIKAENKLGLIDYKTLRKKITSALPYNRHLFYYDQVDSYFTKVDALCDQIEANSSNLNEEELFKLAEYGLQRIYKALDTIDDSGGFRLSSESFFYSLLADGFAKLDWNSNKKVAWLFENYCSERTLDINIDDFYSHLNKAEQNQLNELALVEWQNLKSYESFAYDQTFSVFNLQQLLVKFAKINEDWPAVIAIYEKTAKDLNNQTKQLKREIDYQLFNQAETRLARLKKQAKERYDRGELCKQEVRLAQNLKQTERQIEAQWQCYLATESLEDLLTLLEWEPPIKQKQRLKEAEDFLLKHILENQKKRFPRFSDHLVDLLLYQSKTKQAYDLVKQYPASEEALLKIAEHPDTTFINAWQLFENLIARQIEMTNNKAYKEALKLIKKAAIKVTNEVEQHIFLQLLNELREEYKRKVNFTKWLDELTPKLF